MDTSILIVLIILAATVVLLITEAVRIDMVAILCMLAMAERLFASLSSLRSIAFPL